MNNSDIIAALSLSLTVIIFLMQTDDSLLRTKISRSDKVFIILGTVAIVMLSNAQVFARFNLTYYFTIYGFYLTPSEWALLIFLLLVTIGLYRLFSRRIFNNDPVVLMQIVRKYRNEKKMEKLNALLLQVMELPDFSNTYAEMLDDEIFNDHHAIEYFCSDYPGLVIAFSNAYPEANINRGDHLFYILNGLFADKRNPIYSEIRQYRKEDAKGRMLVDWQYCMEDFNYARGMNYETNLPIIHWLVGIIQNHPSRLKEDTTIFLSQYASLISGYNQTLVSEEYIQTTLSRDPVYNILQLFRIILVESSFTDDDTRYLMDRILLVQYSAWDFIAGQTIYTDGVQLNNDQYSINEYFLKYLFETYCLLFVLNKRIGYTVDQEPDEKEDIGWTIKQLFSKLAALWSGGKVCEDSKLYYINELLDLYFELTNFFTGTFLADTEKTILFYFKDVMKDSPYGDSKKITELFRKQCDRKEFYRKNNQHADNKRRAKQLHDFLLPATQGLEREITDK